MEGSHCKSTHVMVDSLGQHLCIGCVWQSLFYGELELVENVLKLKLLLSSPRDLSDERKLVAEVVDNINLDSGVRNGFVLELVRWETHTFPAVGEYSQDVINEQFPDDVSIFLGMLGGYFGTPTPKFGSGTEEEFSKAFEQFKSQGFPKIMFYFHDLNRPVSELDLTQLQKVQNFKRRIGGEGVYYWSYQEKLQLPVLLHRHITSVLFECLAELRSGETKDIDKFRSSSLPSLTNYEMLVAQNPFLAIDDLAECANGHLKKHTSAMGLIAEETQELTRKFIVASKRLFNAQKNTDARQIVEAVQAIASSLLRFRKCLHSNIPILKDAFEASMVNLQRIISLSEVNDLSQELGIDDAIADAEEARGGIRRLAESCQILQQELQQQIVEGAVDRVNTEMLRISALIDDLVEYTEMANKLVDELRSQS